MPKLPFAIALACLLPSAALSAAAPDSAVTAVAVRTPQPVVIDGRPDDAVWHTAPVIADFVQFSPVEGGPARFRTEAQVAFDDHNFYCFIRAYDPEPAKISTVLARRDVRPPTDQLKIVIDAFHDRRTGFEFAVSPGGVKRDYAIYNDNNEDGSWDGVWDVATKVDSLGWTAEFAIPLSQLRYPSSPAHTFGFAIWRDIERYKERVSWPAYRPSQIGFVSQLGDITGIDGIPAPHRFDVMPYTVAKNEPRPTTAGFNRHQSFTGGADFKFGLTSNFTLDGTVDPDFGQVEQDPAVLNLSVFETFLQEKRPFFLEGTGVYQFPVNSNQVNNTSEGLFYSRRIGRAPQLGPLYGTASSPTSTTILGAAKLTGRSAGGLTVGVLDAVTRRETGISDLTIEPATHYGVVRLEQDLNKDRSGVGLIFTSVDRSLDSTSRGILRRSAYVGGLDARHEFGPGHNYQLNAAVTASRIAGSHAAVLSTQTDPAHYYQRPDGALELDTTRTKLSGDAETLHLAKYGGGIVVFETSYQRISPGYEINDLGFLNRADWQDQSTWMGLQFLRRTRWYNQLNLNFNEWQDWTSAGLQLERAMNTNEHVMFHNNWFAHAGATLGQLGATFSDRATRGGPALRQSPYQAPWVEIQGDQRRMLYPDVYAQIVHTDEGRTHRTYVNPTLQVRVSARMTPSLGMSYSRNQDNTQWFGNFADSTGATHYTFAHLDQTTVGLTFRVDYTASPTLTLQVYANPFVSKGDYSDVREVVNARAAHYADRFAPYAAAVAGNPRAFNVKDFNSSTVLRWEYRPGSSLYLVWTQGRQDFESLEGSRALSGDLDRLFRVHPANTFLIKVAHWFDL
ncbi:MAG TPA: DUF5916 domain-containing protein [Candidatus Eisenbacteria bacterium]|nr:DUF5916 domain-containing protein [Candidatus Eisenbacteria bacterium]